MRIPAIEIMVPVVVVPQAEPLAAAVLRLDGAELGAVVDPGGKGVGLLAAGAAAHALAAGRGADTAGSLALTVKTVDREGVLDGANSDGPILVLGEAGEPVGVVPKHAYRSAAFDRLSRRLQKVLVALDGAYNAVVIVDAEENIVLANRAFGVAVDRPGDRFDGRPIREIVPNTRLPEVLTTGRPHIGTRIVLGGHTYLSNRTPIFVGDQVVGAVAVLQDVTDLEAAQAERDEANRLRHVLEAVLDSAYEGIIVVDQNAVITMFNKAYGEFLGVDPATMVGQPVTKAIENTRMHIVLETGEAEIRRVQRIKGHDMVCDRIPIRDGERVVGAVGKVLFRDVSELDSLAEESQRLRSQLEYYKGELRRQNGTRYSLDSIVGQSAAIRTLKSLVRRIARTQSTVLIQGESGTGKELVAHAIHNLSPRASGPFVKVNCAALPENLLESELFGYWEGAFTGARKGGQVGKFELADGGTVFLDEVGELSLATQAKLLRVLQEREIERLGEGRQVQIDVRVVAATNSDLSARVETGTFRADLLYRLNVISLDVPPLRDRREDIPVLAEHLLARLTRTMACGSRSIDPITLGLFLAYRWPGNIRELENVVERSLNLCEGERILPVHLPHHLRRPGNEPAGLPTLRQVVEQAEIEHLRWALEATGGSAVAGARLVGIGKSAFYEKAARYDLLSRPRHPDGRI